MIVVELKRRVRGQDGVHLQGMEEDVYSLGYDSPVEDLEEELRMEVEFVLQGTEQVFVILTVDNCIVELLHCDLLPSQRCVLFHLRFTLLGREEDIESFVHVHQMHTTKHTVLSMILIHYMYYITCTR